MRVVSLLPAATEIVGLLGMLDDLVGVSHECDFPAAARDKPRVTACAIHGQPIASDAIDRWVKEQLHQGADLFTLDEALLRRLRPDVILTQKLCDVCAPAYGSVAALAQTLPGPPRVVNLEPSSLNDILDNIRLVAQTMGIPRTGDAATQGLQERIDRVRDKASQAKHRPRVAVIEWLDPVFCSGHWTPELVEIAGGEEVLGKKWQNSMQVAWPDVAKSKPDILVIACCGQSAERAREDWQRVRLLPDVQTLDAVKNGHVHVLDGNAYFSRPGPRVVDTLEILASIIHP